MYGEILEGIKKDLHNTKVMRHLMDAIESSIYTAMEEATAPDSGFHFNYGNIGQEADVREDMEDGVGDAMRDMMVQMAIKEVLLEEIKGYAIHTEKDMAMEMASIEYDYMTQNNA